MVKVTQINIESTFKRFAIDFNICFSIVKYA